MRAVFSKVHPELQAVAKRRAPFAIDLNRRSLSLIRFGTQLMRGAVSPITRIDDLWIAVGIGAFKLRLRTYRPKAATGLTPAFLWFHGGGYVIGRPELDDRDCIALALELGITVVSVDYRLAPQHPFPAALDDAYAALSWVHSNAGRLGVDPARLAIGGASAGGGLAAALAQLAYDRGEITPRFQLLVYPMLDDRTALRTDLDDASNITWSLNSNRFGWQSYLGKPCGADETQPYAVPSRRTDLSGLPPAWIGVGTLDLFHDEDVAYANELRASGVDCELAVVPGAYHGFDLLVPHSQVARTFRSGQRDALRRYLFRAVATGCSRK